MATEVIDIKDTEYYRIAKIVDSRLKTHYVTACDKREGNVNCGDDPSRWRPEAWNSWGLYSLTPFTTAEIVTDRNTAFILTTEETVLSNNASSSPTTTLYKFDDKKDVSPAYLKERLEKSVDKLHAFTDGYIYGSTNPATGTGMQLYRLKVDCDDTQCEHEFKRVGNSSIENFTPF